MISTFAFPLALLANVLFWTGLQSLFPVLPLYVASLGGTPTDNGLTTFAAASAAVLSRLFIGAFADRIGRKPILVLGGMIAVLSPILTAMSHTIPALLAVRALHGVGIAAFSTGFQALLADLAPPDQRGQVFGIGNNSGAAASLVGPVMGGWLLAQGGFGAAFGLAAISGSLCLSSTLLLREPSREIQPKSSAPPLQGARETLALRNVRAGLVAVSPLGLAFGAMVTFWPLVAAQNHLSTTGAFYSIYALGMLTVQILAGRISDRIGRARVMLPGMLLTGIAFALIPQARSDVASLVVAFGSGAGLGIARTAIDALVLDGVPGVLRGTAVAAEFTLNDVWIGLGSALLGPLAGAAGFGVAYGIAGAACILVALALAQTSNVMRQTSNDA